MKRIHFFTPVLFISALWLAGCANDSGIKKDEAAAIATENLSDSSDSTKDLSGAGATASGISDGTTYEGDELTDPSSILATRVFYFKFDSSEIEEDDRVAIEAHGNYLAKHPGTVATLEGHTDEQGAREYNLALGERRADTVKSLILLMGATADQVKVVSYGEEHPAVEGHNISAWKLNRRVEIVYPTNP
ncbi:OmpA family protein [Candidatus Nitrosacidococcus sp. I8]|uniref:OmpA family protein n=1 Tax=Candidatus Nitrosacidococcus sp. I8 TaxID=2942908 RepID=UPI00222661E5|nr:OmpA family protein [Candidatus Nitrosacidococcus sp. I8]CAH9019764.1 Peptidoglycan-associated lipoprotein [Candidatus Nitrosacidococcus sp. I8]